jgi:TRAP-type C4-dicarboxylate transport system permease small subunit
MNVLPVEIVDGPPIAAAPLPAPLRWLGRAVDLSVIGIGGLMIALVFLNVVLHVFGKDLAWVTELGEFLMVWVTFLGGAAAAQRGAHMTITEFLDKLDPGRRRIADAAVQCICLIVLGFLLFYGWRIVAGSWGNTLTTLEWPMAWQYLPLPLGAALMLVFGAWDLVLILRGVPREQRYPLAD